MAPENTVLSLNPDGQGLRRHERALRENGFEIVTAATPVLARFEIEMGRCGIFLSGSLTPLAIVRDLISLFKRNCPGGVVIFVAQQPADHIPGADILLSDQDDPAVLTERIRSQQATKAGRV